MILQALTRYYEALAAQGRIPQDGWAEVKVSWALELSPEGQVLSLLPLTETETRKGKLTEVPRRMRMPAPVKRTAGIAPNFLCDNAAYILGLAKTDTDKDVRRAAEAFDAARSHHLSILDGVSGEAAEAVRAFFETWEPGSLPADPVLGPHAAEITASAGGITFFTDTGFVSQDPEIAQAWRDAYQTVDSGDATAVCLVTGKRAVPEAVHPAIKGVRGAQSSGAAIVSFNADAFTSYGKEQSLNAPVSKYAAFAYTTALNYLLADMQYRRSLGDATVVFWAENGDEAYQDYMSAGLDGGSDTISQTDLKITMDKLAQGAAADTGGLHLEPSNRFCVLALSPNNARVAVRFFYDTHFGDLARNMARFYDETAIIGAEQPIPVWRILAETVRRGADGRPVSDPSPQVTGDLLRAVLTGGPYPETLLQQLLLRIRSEQDITRIKAAATKAFLLRNRKNHPDYPMYKEALGVKLNEETTYLPYVLGELFAVLERIQTAASGATTIKDRFFSSACATPALVFPRIIDLASHHLRKLEGGLQVYYAKELGALMNKIVESYPKQLGLDDQGIFQIGYYHKEQQLWAGKNAGTEKKEDATHA